MANFTSTVDWSNVTDAASFLGLANDTTGGWFWVNMLAMIWIVLGISLLAFGFYPALLGSSFAILVIGILFVYMGLIGWTWIAAIVGLMVLVFFWIGYSSSRYNPT